MIDYTPFWDTLKTSKETTYTLTKKYGISAAIIDKLRHNKPMNTTTLNDLCAVLNCELNQIIRYIPSNDDQTIWNNLK